MSDRQFVTCTAMALALCTLVVVGNFRVQLRRCQTACDAAWEDTRADLPSGRGYYICACRRGTETLPLLFGGLRE